MNNEINVKWCNINNFGDKINSHLIEKISGKKVKYSNNPNVLKYICIGSILDLCDRNTIVWGAGFIAGSKGRFSFGTPKEIRALRGPLSAKLIKDKYKIKVPEVYGDPVLLCDRYYKFPVKKKYEVGIIPHYIDKNNPWLTQFKDSKNVLVIDVLDKVENTIKNVLSCNILLSSSLHGVIIGDVYNIPSYWIELSNKVFGNGFKFYDYFQSVKRNEDRFVVNNNTKIKEILNKKDQYEIDIDLDKLYNNCPFKP